MTTTPDLNEARIQAAALRTLDLDASADMMGALADELERLRALVDKLQELMPEDTTEQHMAAEEARALLLAASTAAPAAGNVATAQRAEPAGVKHDLTTDKQSLTVGDEPLFLLHCGQIDSDGEQDEWEIQADSYKRVEEFCRHYPGQTIKLHPHPPQPAAQGVARQPLTKAQVDACWDGLMPSGHGKSRYDIARAIESAALAQAPAAVPLTDAKDAARYRWLRDQRDGDWGICAWTPDDWSWDTRAAAVVDAAIDAAMGAAKEQP